MSGTVFTIGHSNHPAERLFDLLRAHCVDAVCDVRSTPYSQFTPQFNRAELKHSLPQHGVRYIFLGAELGARSEDRACYTNGKINYQLLSATPLFQSGLARVQEGLKKNFRIALMCAEKEPLECHRFVLVSRALAALDLDIQHIHADGTLESHADALIRLAALVHVPEADLFRSAEELRDEAYYRQEQRIAYRSRSRRTRRHCRMTIFTAGFTRKSAEAFFTGLKQSGATRLIDVRLNNTSQLAAFAKRDDLRYFLKAICDIEYMHLPDLAPTAEILDSFKKQRHTDWPTYERQFVDLISSRRIEQTISPELLTNACLLCSEEKPHHCHRRLVAEYLQQHWPGVVIEHLA